jgi:hypothetical protein
MNVYAACCLLASLLIWALNFIALSRKVLAHNYLFHAYHSIFS